MGILRSPAFSLYVRDILCSPTIRKLHATPGVRGLGYFYLLCASWLEEPTATLPDDMDQLASMAQMGRDEFEKFWPLISHQFEKMQDGRLYNPRLYREYDHQIANRERKARQREKSSHGACHTSCHTPSAKTKTKTKPEKKP